MTRLATIAALALLAWAGAAQAQERPLILRGIATQPGLIHLVVAGTPGDRVDLAEIVGPVRRPLPPVVVPPFGALTVAGAAKWTCARASRRFVATNAKGEQSYFSLRTPSCRNRVAVVVPRRAREGSRVRIRLIDTFNLSGQRARLCVAAPTSRPRCRSVRLPARGRAARRAVRATKRGRWRVTVATAHQRTSRTVSVGVPVRGPSLPHVFFTGDSMMQSIDNVITDRLAGRAETTSDVFVGTALSKPGSPFIANTAKRVRKLRAAATVVFLGANDGYPLRTSTGATAECCDEPWVAAYTSRARRLIRAGGRRTIFITLPAPRDADLRPIFLAVNAAIRRATTAEARGRMVDLVPTFTPGFVYRDFLPQRGKPLYVRESDGIHISIDGAPIVSSLVIAALERSGAIRRRR